MITSAPFLMTSNRINRYQYQMYQASLRSLSFPISAHSTHPFFIKQDKWMTQASISLSNYLQQVTNFKKATDELKMAMQSQAKPKESAIQNVMNTYNSFLSFLDDNQTPYTNEVKNTLFKFSPDNHTLPGIIDHFSNAVNKIYNGSSRFLSNPSIIKNPYQPYMLPQLYYKNATFSGLFINEKF